MFKIKQSSKKNIGSREILVEAQLNQEEGAELMNQPVFRRRPASSKFRKKTEDIDCKRTNNYME